MVLIASILLTPVSLFAQSVTAPTSDWSRLTAVESGSKLAVRLKSGKTVDGKLSGVSDSVLSLSVKNQLVEVKREDVRSVHQVTKKSATKATLIGLGVGAGAGAAVGVAGGSNNSGFEKIEHAATAGLAVLGSAAGALTGYLIGRKGSKRVLIYETSQP
jgi:hypothetical protein